ncbi:MAG: FeoC-like transcriptional regulator [Enterobacteriaceae bacterium]
MASLMQTLDAVLVHGMIGAEQLSRQLNISPALVKAMLEKLEQMGKVERVEICASSGCKNCAEGNRCQMTVYRAIQAQPAVS